MAKWWRRFWWGSITVSTRQRDGTMGHAPLFVGDQLTITDDSGDAIRLERVSGTEMKLWIRFS